MSSLSPPISDLSRHQKNLLESAVMIMRTILAKDQAILLTEQLYLPPEKPVCRSRSNRTGHWTPDWFQFGKGVVKTAYCHPAYLTYMQSTSSEKPGWMKHKLESTLQGEASITSYMQMTPPLWQKAKRNWRASWWKWKRSGKADLKLNIQKT